MFRALAAMVLLVHFGFVVFVAAGGALLGRWPRIAWAHLPAAAWGAAIEFTGGRCPLTPLEQYLRMRGGEPGYAGGFIEHYLTSAIYPQGLTRGTQIVLGATVVLVNVVLYSRWRGRQGGGDGGAGARANARKRSV